MSTHSATTTRARSGEPKAPTLSKNNKRIGRPPLSEEERALRDIVKAARARKPAQSAAAQGRPGGAKARAPKATKAPTAPTQQPAPQLTPAQQRANAILDEAMRQTQQKLADVQARVQAERTRQVQRASVILDDEIRRLQAEVERLQAGGKPRRKK